MTGPWNNYNDPLPDPLPSRPAVKEDIEYRYVVYEEMDGGLAIQKIPARVRRTTVILHRSMAEACGKTIVPRVWWDSLPQTPEAAATRWRKGVLDSIEADERRIKDKRDQVAVMDRDREKIIARFKKRMMK